MAEGGATLIIRETGEESTPHFHRKHHSNGTPVRKFLGKNTAVVLSEYQFWTTRMPKLCMRLGQTAAVEPKDVGERVFERCGELRCTESASGDSVLGVVGTTGYVV